MVETSDGVRDDKFQVRLTSIFSNARFIAPASTRRPASLGLPPTFGNFIDILCGLSMLFLTNPPESFIAFWVVVIVASGCCGRFSFPLVPWTSTGTLVALEAESVRFDCGLKLLNIAGGHWQQCEMVWRRNECWCWFKQGLSTPTWIPSRAAPPERPLILVESLRVLPATMP